MASPTATTPVKSKDLSDDINIVAYDTEKDLSKIEKNIERTAKTTIEIPGEIIDELLY